MRSALGVDVLRPEHDAALASGYVTAEQYDRWVRPGDMVRPG